MESKGKERRAYPRYLCSHLTELEHRGRRRTLLLEDIGPGGVAAACEEAVETGASVSLWAAGEWQVALVRYCLRRETDFRLGLQFVSGYRWQVEGWQPEHLWLPGRNLRQPD